MNGGPSAGRPGNGASGRPAARWFWPSLGVILLAGFLHRLGYLLAQPTSDPWFYRPAFDGGYYLEWAKALASGSGGPDGAYYLAPLYPHLLALFLAVAGERLAWLYLLQHLLIVGSAAVIAVGGRRRLGDGAALTSAALLLSYAPLLFFASRPLGEPLGIFLLFASLAAAWRPGARAGGIAGALSALAALARPNLLLVPLLWLVGAAMRKRWISFAALALGAGLVILPVTLRNWVVSGHAVPISSNGGLTSYHGNGPGARGVYTAPAGFSGELRAQQEEAWQLARLRSGRELDAVEADRWWGRQAMRARMNAPLGSVGLLARRSLMTLDSHEYGLDYAPLTDTNPWSAVLRTGDDAGIPLLPLGALLGLAVAGMALRGFRGSGGYEVWSAVAACVAAPLLFYVSSRYRLPFAAMLVIPAGCGLVAIFRPPSGVAYRRRVVGLSTAVVICAISLLMPFNELKTRMGGEDLSKRAEAYRRIGDLDAAERDIDAAMRLAPRSAVVRHNAGVLAESKGDAAAAESLYREAFELDPDLDAAAGNLAALLILGGRAEEAIPIVRRALVFRPTSALCWNNLVVAYLASGESAAARGAAKEAERAGVAVDPGLLQELTSTEEK